MITIRELSETTWDITRLNITVRRPEDGKFIHKWIYGENITETSSMYYDRRDGKLTIKEGRINHHGEAGRGGAEIGWGLKTKMIPNKLLDAPVTRLRMHAMNKWKGTEVFVDVELHELEVMTMLRDGEEIA